MRDLIFRIDTPGAYEKMKAACQANGLDFQENLLHGSVEISVQKPEIKVCPSMWNFAYMEHDYRVKLKFTFDVVGKPNIDLEAAANFLSEQLASLLNQKEREVINV
jgi:hypothetical protein